MLHPAALWPPTGDDAGLAADLASGAAAVLMRLRSEVEAPPPGARLEALGIAGDAAAQAYLASRLAVERPGDAILSEEAQDDRRRLTAERVWIIDPLDGTREFAEGNGAGRWRDDFAVHVALWCRGQGLTDGAVALPASGRVYHSGGPIAGDAVPGGGVAPARRRLRIAVSRTRPPAALRSLLPDAIDLVPMGSTGFKAMAVVDGEVDAYVHAGGQHEWDTAAPVAAALAAGLVASRLDGSALEYNKPEPISPELLICRPAVLPCLRELLAEAGLGRRPGAS